MSKRSADPRRLDVQAFAEAAATMGGEWPLSALVRLTEAAEGRSADDAATPATWQVRGEMRRIGAGSPQTWLHLQAQCPIALLCQRCLNPVRLDVQAKRSFLFVVDEQAAAELDETSEDDVLALTRRLDLQELVEDELLLSLPLVPKHAACPQPLTADGGDANADAPAHPFAVLATLKPRRGSS
ncbi:MAG: YceD family protein [Rhizobacter sp.]